MTWNVQISPLKQSMTPWATGMGFPQRHLDQVILSCFGPERHCSALGTQTLNVAVTVLSNLLYHSATIPSQHLQSMQ